MTRRATPPASAPARGATEHGPGAPSGSWDPDPPERGLRLRLPLGDTEFHVANPSRVDGATVRALAEMLAAQRRLDDTLGPTVLIPSTLAQVDTVTGMACLPGAPPWHYYRSPAFWDLERGRAVYLLPGRAQQAADLLAMGLEALPPDQRAADWAEAYRRDLRAAQARCG